MPPFHPTICLWHQKDHHGTTTTQIAIHLDIHQPHFHSSHSYSTCTTTPPSITLVAHISSHFTATTATTPPHYTIDIVHASQLDPKHATSTRPPPPTPAPRLDVTRPPTSTHAQHCSMSSTTPPCHRRCLPITVVHRAPCQHHHCHQHAGPDAAPSPPPRPHDGHFHSRCLRFSLHTAVALQHHTTSAALRHHTRHRPAHCSIQAMARSHFLHYTAAHRRHHLHVHRHRRHRVATDSSPDSSAIRRHPISSQPPPPGKHYHTHHTSPRPPPSPTTRRHHGITLPAHPPAHATAPPATPPPPHPAPSAG